MAVYHRLADRVDSDLSDRERSVKIKILTVSPTPSEYSVYKERLRRSLANIFEILIDL